MTDIDMLEKKLRAMSPMEVRDYALEHYPDLYFFRSGSKEINISKIIMHEDCAIRKSGWTGANPVLYIVACRYEIVATGVEKNMNKRIANKVLGNIGKLNYTDEQVSSAKKKDNNSISRR
jgi:hypothetical protein